MADAPLQVTRRSDGRLVADLYGEGGLDVQPRPLPRRFVGWSGEAILNTRNAQAAWRGRMHATRARRGR